MKPPSRRRRRTVVRRSVALPASLVEQVSEAAPPEYRGNLNGIVRTALEEYLRNRRREAFERAMEAMAADPEVRAVSAEILRSLEPSDGESLPPA
jgi:hypothetical protein